MSEIVHGLALLAQDLRVYADLAERAGAQLRVRPISDMGAALHLLSSEAHHLARVLAASRGAVSRTEVVSDDRVIDLTMGEDGVYRRKS
jgi:hypothetical protein